MPAEVAAAYLALFTAERRARLAEKQYCELRERRRRRDPTVGMIEWVGAIQELARAKSELFHARGAQLRLLSSLRIPPRRPPGR